MNETPELRLKRLHMRSIRRGIKEMDVILGGFSEAGLPGLSPPELDHYEALLEENDHDLYAWCSESSEAPQVYRDLVEKIMRNNEGLPNN